MPSTSAPTSAPAPVVRTIPELVDFAERHHGESPFLLRSTPAGWSALSFRDAARAVRAFAAFLARAGVRAGDRVALHAENRPEWGLAHLAILTTGAVVVPLDVLLREHEVGEILTAAGATWAVVSARLHPVVERERQARLPGLKLVGLDPIPGLPSWADAQRVPDAAPPPVQIAADDLAVLIYTSGTTGQAKGVMLSHTNLLANVEAVARTFEFGPTDRLLSVLPLHHAFESTAGFLCPMRVGASVAYARSLKSNELREDLEHSGATIMLGVPLLYEKLLAALRRGIDEAPLAHRFPAQLLNRLTRAVRAVAGARIGHAVMRPLRARAGLERIRMFVSGASGLSADVFWGLTDLGWTVVEGYGLTECAPIVAANRPGETQPGSVGWPLDGIEVRIESPDARGDGELVVRGPNVMLGYYGNPAATAEVVRDGWFHTGDLGRIQADGRLEITGRLKNMIATAAGKKIYPEEVEFQLVGSPYIREVVVAAGRDPRDGREEPHAHVFPDLGAIEARARALGRSFDDAFVEETLRQDIEERGRRLAPYKRVKRVIVRREEFPKTTTGKIKRPGAADPSHGPRADAVA